MRHETGDRRHETGDFKHVNRKRRKKSERADDVNPTSADNSTSSIVCCSFVAGIHTYTSTHIHSHTLTHHHHCQNGFQKQQKR
jgi:hypothetical protein